MFTAGPLPRRSPKGFSRPRRTNSVALFGTNGQRKYLNGDERQRFIAAAMQAAPTVKTLCLTLIHTGCRISEALGLAPTILSLRTG